MDSTLEKQNKPRPLFHHNPLSRTSLCVIVDSSKYSLTKSSLLPRNPLPTPEIEKMSITTKEGSKEWEKKKEFYEFIVSKKKSLEGNESKSLCGEFKNGKLKELEEGFECETRTRRQSVSFGAAQVEVANIFAGNGVKIVAVDMPPFMQIHAVSCARKTRVVTEKFTSKALASTLKKEFDGFYGPAWHCIVGSSFGSFVTHSLGGFLYFSMDQKLYILLFKTAVQKS